MCISYVDILKLVISLVLFMRGGNLSTFIQLEDLIIWNKCFFFQVYTYSIRMCSRWKNLNLLTNKCRGNQKLLTRSLFSLIFGALIYLFNKIQQANLILIEIQWLWPRESERETVPLLVQYIGIHHQPPSLSHIPKGFTSNFKLKWN